MKRIITVSLITCLLLAGIITSVNAGTITSASIIETSEQFGLGFGLQNIVDQSGLYNPNDSNLDKYISGKTDFDSYVESTYHNYPFVGNEWFSPDGQTSGYIIFDLGSTYNIEKLAIWNEDSHGISDFFVSTSINNQDYSDKIRFSDNSNNSFMQDYLADTYVLTPQSIARYVKIEIIQVFVNNNNPNSQHASIGEIAFSTNPVPEPATLILFGTGLVGLLGMRRRKQ